MKIMKSVLGMIVVLCLMMCLAVPAFATSVDTTESSTGASADTTEAATGDTTTEEPTGDATTDTTEPVTEESADEHDHDHEEETSTETTGAGATPAVDKNKGLRTALLVLEVIASVALIVVVLLQSGKESGLGSTISGNSDSYMSKNKKGGMDKLLASSTKWVALVWIVITLLLGLI